MTDDQRTIEKLIKVAQIWQFRCRLGEQLLYTNKEEDATDLKEYIEANFNEHDIPIIGTDPDDNYQLNEPIHENEKVLPMNSKEFIIAENMKQLKTHNREALQGFKEFLIKYEVYELVPKVDNELKKDMAGAPKGNKNAEKWTIEEATKFLDESLILAKEKAHDFIGEVARDMDQYRELYTFLIDKFPQLKPTYNRIVQECETNCFSHGKKGDIVPSLAIMNLKSNHKWTDRQEIDHNVKTEQPLFGDGPNE